MLRNIWTRMSFSLLASLFDLRRFCIYSYATIYPATTGLVDGTYNFEHFTLLYSLVGGLPRGPHGSF